MDTLRKNSHLEKYEYLFRKPAAIVETISSMSVSIVV